MTIEQRLQLTIGFIKQGNTSTQEQLITFLVSQGDTQEAAVAALPLYLGMMTQFGYIDTPTYEAMRDWGNSRTVEQITTATTAMLQAYEGMKKKEVEIKSIMTEIEDIKTTLAGIDASACPMEELIAVWEESRGKPMMEQRLEELTTKLNGYNL